MRTYADIGLVLKSIHWMSLLYHVVKIDKNHFEHKLCEIFLFTILNYQWLQQLEFTAEFCMALLCNHVFINNEVNAS